MCQNASMETHRGLLHAVAESDEPQKADEWNRMVLHPDGRVEELWDFDNDAYAIAIVGLAHQGMLKALPIVVLALVTPALQLIAFYKIFHYLQELLIECDEADQTYVGPLVKLVCFCLMFLQLSNEALEGFYKIVFSLRGTNSMYINASPMCYLFGVMLGGLQLQMALGTIALSMVLVSHAETCLDAFMNNVALSFVLEIDNMLMACRLLPLESYDRRLIAKRMDTVEGMPDGFAPWNLVMLFIMNISVLSFFPMGVPLFRFAGVAMDWTANCVSLALLFFGVNCTAWFGSRRWGASNASLLIAYVIHTMLYTNFLYHFRTGGTILCDLLVMPLFLFALMAPACGIAGDYNPFEVLNCPIRVPSLIVLSIGSAVMWMDQMHHNARGCS